MKKLGSIALILLLTMMVFTGCGSKDGGAADSDGAVDCRRHWFCPVGLPAVSGLAMGELEKG